MYIDMEILLVVEGQALDSYISSWMTIVWVKLAMLLQQTAREWELWMSIVSRLQDQHGTLDQFIHIAAMSEVLGTCIYRCLLLNTNICMLINEYKLNAQC